MQSHHPKPAPAKNAALDKKIKAILDQAAGDEKLAEYSPIILELAHVEYKIDDKGNATVDPEAFKKALYKGLKGYLHLHNDHSLDNPNAKKPLAEEETTKGMRAAVEKAVGGSDGADYIEREVIRLWNERFLPTLTGATPLNNMPELTEEAFKASDGKKMGNIRVKVEPYEIQEHHDYLNMDSIKNNPIENADRFKIVVPKEDVDKLKKFGLHVTEPATKRHQKTSELDKTPLENAKELYASGYRPEGMGENNASLQKVRNTQQKNSPSRD